MTATVTFDEYIESLSRLTDFVDPTVLSANAAQIKAAALSLEMLHDADREALTAWAQANPNDAHVLGLALGLSQERLKNIMREMFGTTSIVRQAKINAEQLITRLDDDFELVRILSKQISVEYSFGDILVARAGSRVRATAASNAGRAVEDAIEATAIGIGLRCETRTQFVGREGRTAPCDLVIPDRNHPKALVVAAKGFDSTGSKLTDAVREIEDVANVRLSTQWVGAVIDGIGWLSRQSDLRTIHSMWNTGKIDGLYTLSSLDRFREDLEATARIHGHLSPAAGRAVDLQR